MEKLSLILMILIGLIIQACQCKKEETPCITSCGPEQTCVSGQCECPDGYFKNGIFCIGKTPTMYLGATNCGCLDTLIIDTNAFESGTYNIFANNGSINGDPVQKIGENTYRFMARNLKACLIDGSSPTNIQFTVEIKGDELEVHTSYFDLDNGKLLGECESIFKK